MLIVVLTVLHFVNKLAWFFFHLQTFQQELGARATTVAFVQKSAKEIISKSEGDTSNMQSDLIELSSAWDRVCKLSVSKQERLEQAHKLVSSVMTPCNCLL